MSIDLNNIMIKSCIKKIINAKHAIPLNLQDRNTVQFAICVFLNLIIIAFGTFLFYKQDKTMRRLKKL